MSITALYALLKEFCFLLVLLDLNGVKKSRFLVTVMMIFLSFPPNFQLWALTICCLGFVVGFSLVGFLLLSLCIWSIDF